MIVIVRLQRIGRSALGPAGRDRGGVDLKQEMRGVFNGGVERLAIAGFAGAAPRH